MAKEVIKLGQQIWMDWERCTSFPVHRKHLDRNENYIAVVYSNFLCPDKSVRKWAVLFCGPKTQPIKELFEQLIEEKEYSVSDIDLLKQKVDSILIRYNNLLIFE